MLFCFSQFSILLITSDFFTQPFRISNCASSDSRPMGLDRQDRDVQQSKLGILWHDLFEFSHNFAKKAVFVNSEVAIF